MNTIFIFGAKYLFLLSFIIVAIYTAKTSRDNQKRLAILNIIALPLIYIVALIAGKIYYNPRPFVVGHFTPLIPHDANNGFPSDHTLITSALAAVFMYINHKVSIVLWLIAICVGISRVYVGIHHPIDIIGSIVISFVVTSAVYIWAKNYFFSI